MFCVAYPDKDCCDGTQAVGCKLRLGVLVMSSRLAGIGKLHKTFETPPQAGVFVKNA
jgi:hypothetical protein